MSTKFLSYSQNNEDVLLWRALGHVRDGFYIDVGANDPVEHSVTKAFYDAGWRGINIEPLPAFHDAFVRQRPRDVNLAEAAGSSDGSLVLYDIADVNGWASPERAVAEGHRAAGHAVRELTVPVRTLASVCSEHVAGEIHFLKIDVEGFEGEVLRGMDFARWRPWVLVIEATLPNSRETCHAAWEHLVLEQRYLYAWFDGLNRYYVAGEHAELLRHFSVQPNVFDGFISYHLDQAWSANREALRALKEHERQAAALRTELHDTGGQRDAAHAALDGMRRQADAVRAELQAARGQADAAHAELGELRQHAGQLARERQDLLEQAAQLRQALAAAQASGHHLSEWARGLEARLTAMLDSRSWRLTKPLRKAGALWIRLRRPGLARRVLLRATRSQALRRVVLPLLLPLLQRFPPLGMRVSSMLRSARHAAPPAIPPGIEVPPDLRGLPESVRKVLADLQRAHPRQHEPNK